MSVKPSNRLKLPPLGALEYARLALEAGFPPGAVNVVKVNRDSRLLMADGKPSGNMFAAGEILAGNVLGRATPLGLE